MGKLREGATKGRKSSVKANIGTDSKGAEGRRKKLQIRIVSHGDRVYLINS